MDFNWIKTPKSDKEEKEQFDKLYHLLVQLSEKGKENEKGKEKKKEEKEENSLHHPSSPKKKEEPMEKTGDLDEFMRLKMDILANFHGGVEITPLQTCKGCDRSFYSEGERDKHFEQSPACMEWTKRNLSRTPLSAVPFFTFMEQGMSILMDSSSSSSCRFCHKSISHRKALEKHYQHSVICNRLAHDTFQKWYQSAILSQPSS